MAKTYRVKAVQHKEEVVVRWGFGFDTFILPEMNMDGEEFLVQRHPLRGRNWYIVVGDQWHWNYHKDWLIFLDTESKPKRKKS